MTKEKINTYEVEKYRITIGVLFIGLILFFGVLAINIKADEMVFKFKNPSFSGVGTSAHYLTIENQEFNRKEALRAEIKALQEQIERDKENTKQSCYSINPNIVSLFSGHLYLPLLFYCYL